MPTRATKRGKARSALQRDCDVLICGASFAGLALARELEGAGANVLIVDRYEIGERQTSACAAPTNWLARLGLAESIKQTFDELVVHTTTATARWPLPFSFSTFDYRELCRLLRAGSPSSDFDTATVAGVDPGAVHTVHTDRGELRAPLVVDALGWRRVLAQGEPIQLSVTLDLAQLTASRQNYRYLHDARVALALRPAGDAAAALEIPTPAPARN